MGEVGEMRAGSSRGEDDMLEEYIEGYIEVHRRGRKGFGREGG